MMSKINILIFAAILLSFMVTTSVARPDSTLQSKSKETEKCETGECMMKTTSDAHLDYIYTQPSPPKSPLGTSMEKKCETEEECLMKTTSDAHLDYIYTQTPAPEPASLNANP